jgi:hypothetical protein
MGNAALEPGIVAMAQAIEFAGADSISVSDHLLSFSQDKRRTNAQRPRSGWKRSPAWPQSRPSPRGRS